MQLKELEPINFKISLRECLLDRPFYSLGVFDGCSFRLSQCILVVNICVNYCNFVQLWCYLSNLLVNYLEEINKIICPRSQDKFLKQKLYTLGGSHSYPLVWKPNRTYDRIQAFLTYLIRCWFVLPRQNKRCTCQLVD